MKRILLLAIVAAIVFSGFSKSNVVSGADVKQDVKFELVNIRVLIDMLFKSPNMEYPSDGNFLLVLNGNVTTTIDTHNARIEAFLKDSKGNVLDSDMFYLNNTTANQSKNFRIVFYGNEPLAWINGSVRFLFVSDELIYDTGYKVL